MEAVVAPAHVAAPVAAAPGQVQDATSRIVLLPPGPLLMTLRLLHALRVDDIKEDTEEVDTMLCRMSCLRCYQNGCCR
jgi:hypothetical protein